MQKANVTKQVLLGQSAVQENSMRMFLASFWVGVGSLWVLDSSGLGSRKRLICG